MRNGMGSISVSTACWLRRLLVGAAAALLGCALVFASGCAGCSAESGDLLATTEQAQQSSSSSSSESSSSEAQQSSSSVDVDAADSGESQSASAEESSEGSQESGSDSASADDESKSKDNGKGSSKSDSGGSKTSSGGEAKPSPAPDPEPAPEQPSTITVTVTFDSANAAKSNSKFPSSLGTYDVQLEPGATVYDALVKTGVKFTTKGSNYIDSIGGISEKACGASSGWMYSVDGTFPGKSAMKYTLSGGEKIRWAYTVTMGDV